jgi:hypothetical protein
LDHFDAVLDRTELDPQFGIAFFDQLNALKNRPRCFLLCVTQKPYQKYHLYAEQIHRFMPVIGLWRGLRSTSRLRKKL